MIRRASLWAAGLAVLLALPAAGDARANGWEHAGIPFDALIAALAYEDPTVRGRAAHSLGYRGQAAAVPHLLTALSRPETDHGVRSRIYLALGRLNDAAAAPVLFDCLNRESREELRGDCATALGALRSDGARDRLIAVLREDEHLLVKRRAVDALGRYHDSVAVAALAEIASGGGGSGGTEVLVTLQPRAIAALGATGHIEAAAPLLALLTEAATERQSLPIVRALGGLGAPSARAPLTALLDRARHPALRSALVVALAAIADPNAAATMTRLLADPLPMVQLAAIRGLVAHGDPDHARAIAAHARGHAERLLAGGGLSGDVARVVVDASLLEAALRALIALDAARGLDVLLTAARQREMARATTADIVVANAHYQIRRTAIHGLGYTGSGAAAEFLAGREGVSDPDPRIRAVAVRSIAVLGRHDAAVAIIAALADPHADVRMAAAAALGRLADRRGVAPLIERLADRHAQVRRYAAESLGYLADPAARSPLQRRAEDDGSPVVRRAARFALSLLGDG